VWHAISSGVRPRQLVFQKAKNSFKERPQLVLVLFIGGQFAESHPLLLICQIGQISCGVCKLLISLMMSSVCTFRWRQRRALSDDSPSWGRTSAKLITPSQQSIAHIGTYSLCATLPLPVTWLLLPFLCGNRRSRIFIFALWSCDFEFPTEHWSCSAIS
jgi:hypothetical protein